MASGIYAITNIVNGKAYIGSTINFEHRWKGHKDSLRHNRHHNLYLQRSWDKYGEEAFQFMICEYVQDLEQLVKREQHWLDFHRMYVDVYNMVLVVDRSTMSEEIRCSISKAHMGKTLSEEHKRKIGDGNRGKTVSKETRQRMSDAQRGSLNAMWGRVFTSEHRRKIGETSKGNQYALGYKHTEEARRKMCRNHKGMLGKHHTEESKHKISVSKGKPYPAFIHVETGEIIPAGTNLNALCKGCGLKQPSMHAIMCGRLHSCKGWILLRPTGGSIV